MLIISELKRCPTDYGINVKVKLMEQGKTQEWLLEQLREKLPRNYFDSSILYKVLTGQVNSPNMIAAINEILGIEKNGGLTK